MRISYLVLVSLVVVAAVLFFVFRDSGQVHQGSGSSGEQLIVDPEESRSPEAQGLQQRAIDQADAHEQSTVDNDSHEAASSAPEQPAARVHPKSLPPSGLDEGSAVVDESVSHGRQQPLANPAVYQPPETSGASEVLRRFVDRQSGRRLPADFAEMVPKVTEPADVMAVVEVLLDSDDDQAVRNEAINLLRSSGYDDLPEILQSIAHDENESMRFRSFAVQHLGDEYVIARDRKDARVAAQAAARLRPFLEHPEVDLRREAYAMMVMAEDPKVLADAPDFLSHPSSAGMRDVVVDALIAADHRQFATSVRGLIKPGTTEPVLVQMAAIHALSQWGDLESKDLLVAKSKDTSPQVRSAARAALRRMPR